MARQQYPSDVKRKKQRPHVKIHLSIRNHRKTVGHFDSPEFRGQILGLYMLAAERFAAREGGELHLSHSDIKWISGKSQWTSGRKSIESLCKVLEYSVKFDQLSSKTAVIMIPKFAKKQGYGSAPGVDTTRSYAESGSLQGTKEPKNRGTDASPVDGESDEGPKDPYRLPPGTLELTEKQIANLIALKPNGTEHPAHDVACWFAWVHPKMVAAGRVNFPLAASKWFPNLRPGEMKTAREWVRSVNSRESAARIKAEIESHVNPEATPEQLKDVESLFQ